MAFNVYKLYSHVMSSVCSHEWASLALVGGRVESSASVADMYVPIHPQKDYTLPTISNKIVYE